MAIGQAAGAAAAISIDDDVKVQNVNIEKLQEILVNQGATLIYYKDVAPSSSDFKMVQYLGLRGFLPEWNARLNDIASAEELKDWYYKSGIDVRGNKDEKRRDVLLRIYNAIMNVGK